MRQGAIAMLTNLISMLVCSATGLLLLVSGVIRHEAAAGGFLHADAVGMGLLRQAFLWGAPGSDWIASLSLVLFAFTTIVVYGYYGERCFTFLVGPRGRRPFQLAWILVVLAGASQALPGLWALANTLDALLALPNLLGLLLLSGAVFHAVVKPVNGPGGAEAAATAMDTTGLGSAELGTTGLGSGAVGSGDVPTVNSPADPPRPWSH